MSRIDKCKNEVHEKSKIPGDLPRNDTAPKTFQILVAPRTRISRGFQDEACHFSSNQICFRKNKVSINNQNFLLLLLETNVYSNLQDAPFPALCPIVLVSSFPRLRKAFVLQLKMLTICPEDFVIFERVFCR